MESVGEEVVEEEIGGGRSSRNLTRDSVLCGAGSAGRGLGRAVLSVVPLNKL